jgi:hypothetical protein
MGIKKAISAIPTRIKLISKIFLKILPRLLHSVKNWKKTKQKIYTVNSIVYEEKYELSTTPFQRCTATKGAVTTKKSHT